MSEAQAADLLALTQSLLGAVTFIAIFTFVNSALLVLLLFKGNK